MENLPYPDWPNATVPTGLKQPETILLGLAYAYGIMKAMKIPSEKYLREHKIVLVM